MLSYTGKYVSNGVNQPRGITWVAISISLPMIDNVKMMYEKLRLCYFAAYANHLLGHEEAENTPIASINFYLTAFY